MFAKRAIFWLFAGALLLVGSSFAKADCDSCAWRDRLIGTWNNLSTGENIVIGRGQLGLWEVWASNNGEGRIGTAEDKGANLTLNSRAGDCAYYATLINPNQINLSPRGGPDACLKGVFVKVQDVPEPVHHYHVIRKIVRVSCCRLDP